MSSLSNPDVWKITDFGISVSSSGSLMLTRTKQGTDVYMAPEILFERPYSSTVDIWGIGSILYELFAGHRIFNARSEIESYASGQRDLPQLHYSQGPPGTLGAAMVSQTQAVANSFASRMLSLPKCYCEGVQARDQLDDFWKAFKEMERTERRMVGCVCEGVPGRLEEMNRLLKWMLDLDPSKRPTIQVVLHHFRGNYLRSMLENDPVQPPFR
jgi:serine/threonine protein kinase